MKMDEHIGILRKVGLVLIVVGGINIGVMIYCIASQTGYSSSFYIFAVIAGISLMRGSLRAARIISWLVAFFFSGFIGIFIIFLVLLPPGLIAAFFKLHRAFITLWLAVAILITALLVWTYRSLTSTSVRNAMDQRGIKYKSFWGRPSRGFWIGCCLPTVLFLILYIPTHTKTAEEAKQRAASLFGAGYQFYVSSLNVSSDRKGKYVRAVVIAYTDREIKDVEIEWSK